MEKLGVEIQLNHRVQADDVRDFDEIVLASGIHPRQIELEGINHPKVMTYLDVLRERKPIGNKVAIIGSGGIGFDVGEFLSQDGPDSALDSQLFQQEWQIDASLTHAGGLNSTEPQLHPSQRDITICQRKPGVVDRTLGKTTGWIHRLTLKERGVNMLGGLEYVKVDDAGLHVKQAGEDKILAVDHVIVCAGQVPNRDLQAALEALGKPVHLIGGAEITAELDAKRAILSGTQVALSL